VKSRRGTCRSRRAWARSIALLPILSPRALGASVTVSTRGGTTETCAVADRLPVRAMTSVEPSRRPVTRPLSDTVAMLLSRDSQATGWLGTASFFRSVTAALSSAVPPTTT
jgi:hypothetical protein